MALNPLIPLQVDAPADIAGAYRAEKQRIGEEQRDIRQDQQAMDLNDVKLRVAKLDEHLQQVGAVGQLLSSAYDQNSWNRALQQAGQMGLDVADEPQVFDPAYRDQVQMGMLDITDRLKLARDEAIGALNQDLVRAKIGTEQAQAGSYDALTGERQARTQDIRSNPGSGNGGGGGFGNSMAGRAYDILLNGDPSSGEYALAYQEATKPRYQMVTNADGTSQMVAVSPELPAAIRRPMGIGPSGGLQPPPMPGTVDTTPTTRTGLLPAPNAPLKGFNVSPIAGTERAPKFTEDQTKAAGFATRLESANRDLERVFSQGYTPTVGTNIGTALNEKTGTSGFLSTQGQQVDQAKRNFINAQLRRESGATIQQPEFDNANKQYFPMPGDKPEVLAQKKKNRQDAIAGMKSSAGAAYKSTGTKEDPLGLR